jgi:hypothetical protein
MRWGAHPTTGAREGFFAEVAPVLVATAVGPRPRWRPGRRLSGQFGFFGDEDVLAVVAWAGSPRQSADEALAWGLANSGDRDLVLVLPAGAEAPTASRLPWITVPVRLFTYAEMNATAVPVEVVIPAKVEVLTTLRSWGWRGRGVDVVVDDRVRAWLEPLLAWVGQQPELEARHRQSYLSWHVQGRQVLRVDLARDRLEIRAGVRYSRPAGNQLVPLPVIEVTGPLSEVVLGSVTSVVAAAVERRRSRVDAGHEEHRL